MEKKIFFKNQNIFIEGLLDLQNNKKAAIITHPHPLYGGNMYNNIVELLTQVYHNKGYSTLRFNFRGVGNSEGSFDNGHGEQNDLRAAIDYLKKHHLKKHEIKNLDIAGYSFGTWINAHVLQEETEIKKAVMISPPVDFIDFNEIKRIQALTFVVSGSSDEFATPKKVSFLVNKWNPLAKLKIINGADHFFSGYGSEIESVLKKEI